MTLEEYKESLLSRPPEERDALWTLYNYSRFQTLNQELINLRDEALRPEELPTNVVDLESRRKNTKGSRSLSGRSKAGQH